MGCLSTRYASAIRLDGKTAIITGCNTGIGKFTAMDLYKREWHVVTKKKAELAKNGIIQETIGLKDVGELILIPLDLSSLQSVREFATKILNQEKRIDLLINNAGIMMCPKGKTVDGFELQFGTNHLGHFLLTLLLLPRILTSTPARIINLSSLAHRYAGNLDWDNLNAEKSYSPTKNYFVSKLANVLFTKELAKRLEGTGVTVYAIHPGVVNTDLSRHADTMVLPGASWAYQNLTGFLQKDVEQGAATTLYCAIDSKTGSENGLYYADCKATSCHPQGNDANKAKKLWDKSIDMVQLQNYDFMTPKPLE